MTDQVSQCCGAAEVPKRPATCTRCYGGGHELQLVGSDYLELAALCKRCAGEGVEPTGEDWRPW